MRESITMKIIIVLFAMFMFACGAEKTAETTKALSATGATVEEGRDGQPGSAGAPGVAGSKGDTGALGATGAAGVQGTAGPKGDQGEPGTQGPAGMNGAQGPMGPQGPMGLQGPAGAAGTGTALTRSSVYTVNSNAAIVVTSATVYAACADKNDVLLSGACMTQHASGAEFKGRPYLYFTGPTSADQSISARWTCSAESSNGAQGVVYAIAYCLSVN